MRILAVRGAGLASLAERFEVRFDAPPLRDAGVFAIVGPTGAGKSTLLDAICLALYGRTPRLGGRGPRVGPEDGSGEQLPAGDPRNILRKGAASAFAEVDFRGVGGRVYRARWEVRRARRSPHGRLLDPVMSLRDVESGRALADHRKSEALAAIEARLGLSFDQFKRAVLLAQGEFAAFLHSDERARAELLERMTGTEIYGRISIEVARRAKEERDALARVEAEFEAARPLDPVARAELEASLPSYREAVLRAAERVRSVEAHAAWWSQLDALVEEEERALGELEEVERQIRLAEPRRRVLEAAIRAEPVRAPLEALALAVRSEAEARARVAAAEAERARAVADISRAGAREECALEACRKAEAALDALLPRLNMARELDAAIVALRERMAAEQRRLEAARAEVDRCSAELSALESRRLSLEREREAARAVWDAHRALDALTPEEGSLLIERLERVLALGDARREAERAEREARGDLCRREAELERARAGVRAAREAVAEAERRLADRRDALARETPHELLREAVLVLDEAQEDSRRALDKARAISELVEHHLRLELEAATSRARHAASLARARESREAIAELRPLLAEALRARDSARATVDLADRRAELREGEPCPLCGAREHPYVERAPPPRFLEERQARVDQLRTQLEELERQLVRAELEAEESQIAAEEAERRAEEARASSEELKSQLRSVARSRAWSSLVALWERASPPLRRVLTGAACLPAPSVGGESAADGGASSPPPWVGPLGPADLELAALEARTVELERARGRLLDAMRARETAERAYQEARVEREAALRSLAEAEAAAHAAAAGLEASRAYLAEKERERRRIDAERERVQEAIRPALAAIGELVGVEADAALDRVGPDLLVRLRASLEARAEARRAEARIAGALALLEGARGAAQSALVRAQAELVMAEEEHRAASAALATQTAQRRAILDGEADACEEGARREVEAARAELARCRAEKAAALAVVEAAERALEVEVRAAEEAARAVAEARARLARVLAEVGLDEVTARASLARSPAEIAEIRRECEQLEERRARWRAIFEERAARRALHERQRPSGLLPREHIALELETARELEEDARRRLASAEERRARDDRLRAERAAKETELEARRARVRTWSELDDLIGSPHGQRFRIFAQHLTLGILLEHANAHLERLAPRYALVRAPGADLGLQVIDRDMGGEIRGIRSLSGGETFLVSLALALGVGSLAARRVRVDSLFIDEGFGGLDAESLETVLAALDALQATGRQVGIISHVGAIAERFAARIEVRPRGQAESTVAVVG